MGIQRAKCIGVVDGAMFILEGGETVTLAGIHAPRMGIPGGSAMRTVLQRHVQDQDINNYNCIDGVGVSTVYCLC